MTPAAVQPAPAQLVPCTFSVREGCIRQDPELLHVKTVRVNHQDYKFSISLHVGIIHTNPAHHPNDNFRVTVNLSVPGIAWADSTNQETIFYSRDKLESARQGMLWAKDRSYFMLQALLGHNCPEYRQALQLIDRMTSKLLDPTEGTKPLLDARIELLRTFRAKLYPGPYSSRL